jgi:putative membrane protein
MKKLSKPNLNVFLTLNVLFLVFALFTYLHCTNVTDWLVENIIVVLFLAYLFWQRLTGTFHYSALAYLCMYGFLCLHEWGAQYVYSEHPVGEWMRAAMHLQRNGYDRLVHTSFGVLLFVPVWEWLHYDRRMQRSKAMARALQLIFMYASVFEMIEFAVACYIFPDSVGHTYVGTQGDVWDAHKDITLAVLGAGSVMVLVAARQAFTSWQRQRHLLAS